jgi:ATP diphosphatase
MSRMDELLAIMARLRDPEQGCPWDLVQTFESIAPYTLEEAYEVDHAIATGDMEGLRDELGDLLLQVVFHARMAEEARLFDFASVAAAISEKLVRRHPHVFGDPERGGEKVRFANAEDQSTSWERLKAQEREARAKRDGSADGPDLFEGVPLALPALARAVKLRKRVERDERVAHVLRAGEGRPGEPGEAAIAEARRALAGLEGERSVDAGPGGRKRGIGLLLMACVDLSRALGVDPEQSLRDANHELEARARRAAGKRADGRSGAAE